MFRIRALPAGARFAGAVALTLLAATPGWSQGSEPQSGTAQTADQQVVAAVDPIIAEVRRRLAEPIRRNVDRGDRAALAAFYTERSGEPLWVTAAGFTARARDALAEIGKAGDWGLSLAAFELPKLTVGETSPIALADAEIMLGLAVLEYARHARGGRIDPLALTPNFDQKLTLRDPKVVLEAVAATETPGSVKLEQVIRICSDTLPENAIITNGARVAGTARLGMIGTTARWLAPLGFENTYALAVSRRLATQLGLTKISDLEAHPALRMALSHEFSGRDDGWPGLSKRYHLHPASLRAPGVAKLAASDATARSHAATS